MTISAPAWLMAIIAIVAGVPVGALLLAGSAVLREFGRSMRRRR